MNYSKFKTYICVPVIIPQLLLRFFSNYKEILANDQAGTICWRGNPFSIPLLQFSYYFINLKEYRSVYYHRIGNFRILMEWLFPGEKTCYIRTKRDKIGGGICINHGHSLEINAKRIGKNLHVFQNVTIGSRNTPAKPVIGDDVTIGAGAVVLGDIRVGNNVRIGANAVVVDDIPDNCTVVPMKSIIIKRE